MTSTHKLNSGVRIALALAAIVVLFALPTQAMANENCSKAGNDPTAAQYCSVAGVHGKGGESKSNQPAAAEEPVVEAVETEGPVAETASPSESDTLPFTGLDVGILAAVAAALVGTGLVLRRLTSAGVPRS